MQRGEDRILGASETDSTTTSAGFGSSMEEEAGSRRAAAAAVAAKQAFEESRPVESMKLVETRLRQDCRAETTRRASRRAARGVKQLHERMPCETATTLPPRAYRGSAR